MVFIVNTAIALLFSGLSFFFFFLGSFFECELCKCYSHKGYCTHV